MSSLSPQRRQFLASLYATYGSMVCPHVFDGKKVSLFGSAKHMFFAACAEDCHYSDDWVAIRSEHVLQKQPELFTLLHLPINLIAIFRQEGWELEIGANIAGTSDLPNCVYSAMTVDEFTSTGRSYFYGSALGYPSEDFFESGARFFGIWSNKTDAKKHLHRGFLNRVFTRFAALDAASLVEKAIAGGHNYICLQEAEKKWQAIVVNKVLDFDRNVLKE